jgi:putative FmdB family regulatory protein
MLKAPHPAAYNSATALHNHAEVPMPQYEFYCHACKKVFSKVLSLAEYEKGEAICPRCGSKEVEQTWSAFYVITSKKSA